MPTSEYHLVTHWRLNATVNEVADVLKDTLALPRWCPSVYLEAHLLMPGDANGTGKRVQLRTKGWLPYTLRWQLKVSESRYPWGYSIEAEGDFVGFGVWTFKPNGTSVDVTYDWKIEVKKPVVRAFSFLFKPLFVLNHRWAMAKTEKSLKLELARRRARSGEEAARIPPPPAPTFPHNLKYRNVTPPSSSH